MCGRYWIDPEAGETVQLIQELSARNLQVKAGGEIYPGDRVPVLCMNRAGRMRPFAMEWGWRMQDGRRLINARSETAAEKPFFRDSMARRRCLLPMSAYFEWEKRDGAKQKYRIAPRTEGIYYLAGLYRFEDENPVCTVLTREAASDIAFIHHRMPLIVSAEGVHGWLHGANAALPPVLPLEYGTA